MVHVEGGRFWHQRKQDLKTASSTTVWASYTVSPSLIVFLLKYRNSNTCVTRQCNTIKSAQYLQHMDIINGSFTIIIVIFAIFQHTDILGKKTVPPICLLSYRTEESLIHLYMQFVARNHPHLSSLDSFILFRPSSPKLPQEVMESSAMINWMS